MQPHRSVDEYYKSFKRWGCKKIKEMMGERRIMRERYSESNDMPTILFLSHILHSVHKLIYPLSLLSLLRKRRSPVLFVQEPPKNGHPMPHPTNLFNYFHCPLVPKHGILSDSTDKSSSTEDDNQATHCRQRSCQLPLNSTNQSPQLTTTNEL